MIIELHILQNFAPSNLNRDDTGAPKSCKFGGETRARVSSQAAKRAARTYVEKHRLLEAATLGQRSLRFKSELVNRLVNEGKKDEASAKYAADFTFAEAGIIEKEAAESGYLVALGNAEMDALLKLCSDKWDAFQAPLSFQAERLAAKKKVDDAKKEVSKIKKAMKKSGSTPEAEKNLAQAEATQKAAEEELKQVEEKIAEAEKNLGEVKSKIKEILLKKRTADFAMFGRMITSNPIFNIDAASQVAHAVSTHPVSESEVDYFTAMDDVKMREKLSGAALISNTDFNSACYYRYANMDVKQLKENLKDGAVDLAERTAEGFIEAFVRAVPTGKQNSFSSPTMPSLVLVVVRRHGLCSLANAFARPVRVTERDGDGTGLIEKSITQLDNYFGKMERMYGKYAPIEAVAVCTEYDGTLDNLGTHRKDSLEDVINTAVEAAFKANGKEGVDAR